MAHIELEIKENKCPCCERIFIERKSRIRNGIKWSGFYIPSWAYANQRWGHSSKGRWHFIQRRKKINI